MQLVPRLGFLQSDESLQMVIEILQSTIYGYISQLISFKLQYIFLQITLQMSPTSDALHQQTIISPLPICPCTKPWMF